MKDRKALLILALATGLSLFGCNTTDDDTAGTVDDDAYGTTDTGTTGTTGTGVTSDTYGTTGTTGTGMAAMSDDQIQQQIEQQFEADPNLKDLDVDVENGIVILDGEVSAKEHLDHAEQAARQMSGVLDVKFDEVEVQEKQ